MSDPLHTLTISALRRRLRSGEISPADILTSLEDAIAANPRPTGAWLHRSLDDARRDAAAADLTKPLGGIPIGIKDAINVLGQPTTCASRILSGGYTSPYDATVITRLRAAGAVPFGKLNMDEFAMGSSTENSALQQTINPWDPTRVPGGSSGGSAAAVAAHEAIATLGSDTGGSIRQPAAFCGITGLKPSYGRVSRFGLVAYASSLDQIGPMTKNVEDSALVLQAIAGHDPADSTSSALPVPDFSALMRQDIKGLRIGLPKEYFVEGTEPAITDAVHHAVRELERQGAIVQEVSLPHTRYAVATYYLVASAEASANLARFDGIRYGHRTENPADLLDLYKRSRAEGFGPEVKRRIILGTWVLSSGYHEAYYRRAQKVRALIRQDFLRAFESVDVLACPASPTPAFKFGEHSSDPLQMYLADIFTIAANLAGVCGISVPCGLTPATADRPALPIGLQFLGRPFGEGEILRAAWHWEQTSPAPLLPR